MKQYFEMKGKHPDAILLFRVGDFYETFSDDDTGERFPIRRFHPVIMCEKWETLYAKSRAYIFEKFFDK